MTHPNISTRLDYEAATADRNNADARIEQLVSTKARGSVSRDTVSDQLTQLVAKRDAQISNSADRLAAAFADSSSAAPDIELTDLAAQIAKLTASLQAHDHALTKIDTDLADARREHAVAEQKLFDLRVRHLKAGVASTISEVSELRARIHQLMVQLAAADTLPGYAGLLLTPADAAVIDGGASFPTLSALIEGALGTPAAVVHDVTSPRVLNREPIIEARRDWERMLNELDVLKASATLPGEAA